MRFSIIIPAYNAERFIGRCLDSVLNQNFPKEEYEVIVVDDCSPDNQASIINDYKKRYTNLTLIKHSVNKRQGGGRNTALKEAKGEYVFFLDADDWWASTNVLMTFDNLLSLDDYDFIDSRTHIRVNSYNCVEERTELLSYIDKLSASEYILKCYTNYVCTGCYKNLFLQSCNLTFRENAFYEDIDWKFRSVISAKNIGSIDFPFYAYYYNTESTTSFPSISTFRQNISMTNLMVNLVISADVSYEARHKLLSGYKKSPMRLILATRNYPIKDSLIAIRDLKNAKILDSETYDSLSLLDRMHFFVIKYLPVMYVAPLRFATICKRLITILSTRVGRKEILYYLFTRIPLMIKGKIKGNLIYVHWGRGLKNFGDCLSPDILKHYGLTPVYVPNQMKADVVLAGTILQWWVPKEYKGVILGTGGGNYKYSFPNAKILGVRGALTRNNIMSGDTKKIILGDPGLLMSLVYPKQGTPHYKLGIVFHFVDEKEPFALQWRESLSMEQFEICFINVLDKPETVIMKIANCENIVSSSLHGLIIADAYHIPNRRIVNTRTMPRVFYDYKFDDYYSSLGIEDKGIEVDGKESIASLISICTLKPVDVIEELKFNLDEKMKEIAASFKKHSY